MAKLHRIKVTEANLGYVGSITLDKAFLEKSGIKPLQMVIINNLSNGVSWQTYVVEAKRGTGTVCLNGPPARHFQPGDLVIIVAEAYITPDEMKDFVQTVVFVDGKNKITKVEKHKMM